MVQDSKAQGNKNSEVRWVNNIFVGGCKKETAIEDLKDHSKNLQVNLLDCVELRTRSNWSKAFKISVHDEDKTKLMSVES